MKFPLVGGALNGGLLSPLGARHLPEEEQGVSRCTSYWKLWSMDFKNKFIEKASSYGWEINGTGNCVSDNLYSCLYSCLEEDDVVNELDYCTAIEENCLLGYPTYTQLGDPRFEDNRYSKYDTQLFQMVSCNEEGTKFMAMWGDMGIAHFFINHEKLLNKDFSDVMYYWDCS